MPRKVGEIFVFVWRSPEGNEFVLHHGDQPLVTDNRRKVRTLAPTGQQLVNQAGGGSLKVLRFFGREDVTKLV